MTVLAQQNIMPSTNEKADTPYRVLPHNIEAEQAILGALLIDNRLLESVSDFLRPEHFYNVVHGRIYDAIKRFTDKGKTADPVTLKNHFDDDEALSEAGGADYLVELATNVITTVNVYHYGQAIYELFLRRQLIALGDETVIRAFDTDIEQNAEEQIQLAESRLFELATQGSFKTGFVTLRHSLTTAIQHAEKAFKNVGHVTGVTTGLIDMDKKLGGLQSSDLTILAGRPAMGKTALATNIAFNAAKAYHETNGKSGAVVGFFSLEMSADQLATRILASESRVGGDKIRRGEVSDHDFQRFIETSQLLMDIPLHIDDTPGLSISAVRTRARRLQRQHGLGMIVVDYLQLLSGTGSKQSENRVLEISEITRGLKALAKELQVPVLALSQLSRAVESREDKRPQLADLRESGSIEQDADIVMFVYRDEYYLSKQEPKQKPDEAGDKFNARYTQWQELCERAHNVAECIIAKQRHGPIGTVNLFFDGNYTKFDNLTRMESDK